MTARARFEAPDLLRPITNVNGFIPAKSRFPAVRYEIVPDLVVTAADLYVIGRDSVDPIDPPEGMPVDIILPAEQSKELEKFIRGAKRVRIDLEVDEPDIMGNQSIVATNVDTGEVAEFQAITDDLDPEKWQNWFALVDDLMTPLERRTAEELRLPDGIGFQPSRLAVFSKVRVEGEPSDSTVMDLRIFDAWSAVHVKIGPSFRGAIQPITRDKAQEGALWT